jgi:hypothetical protein
MAIDMLEHLVVTGSGPISSDKLNVLLLGDRQAVRRMLAVADIEMVHEPGAEVPEPEPTDENSGRSLRMRRVTP